MKLPGAYKQGRSLLQRVEDSSIPVPESGCWLWLGSTFDDGYPQLGQERVSRLLLGLRRNDPLCALHKCDTALCVNPAHLYAGTQSQNIIDLHTRKPGATGWQVYHERRRTCS